jgi:hypothetical protein
MLWKEIDTNIYINIDSGCIYSEKISFDNVKTEGMSTSVFLLRGGLIPKITPRTTTVVTHAYAAVGEFLGSG